MSTMLREKMAPDLKRRSKWLAYAAIALALIVVGIAIIYTRQRLSIDPDRSRYQPMAPNTPHSASGYLGPAVL